MTRQLVLVLVLVLVLGRSSNAQTPREQGEKLRSTLAKEPPRPALAGKILLPAYLGLARAGELHLDTEIVEKAGEKLYHLEDSLSLDAKDFGSVTMTLSADLGADLSVRELALYTSAPNAAGVISRRKLVVVPQDGALWVTEAKDEDKPKKWKLEGAPKDALVLTPPFGVGERLARLAPGDVGARLSFDAWDLATAAKTSLAVSLDEVAKIDVRGESIEAQKMTRDEGKASLEEWLVPSSREPLVIVRASDEGAAPRIRFVGRESAEKQEDLPEPSPGARRTEGPAATVLRFLRASGRGDAPGVESLLDVDALFAAAKPADTSEKFKAVYRKTLVAMLTSAEWRRGESMKLLALAAREDDLDEKIDGERAKVRAKGQSDDAPAFELAKTSEGWKIVALPRKP